MAYNFRPTSKQQIVSKKKKFSDQAALVYAFVNSNYGETIILDPSTNFNKIKVPRVVESKIKIGDLKTKLKKAGVDLTGIDVAFGNGSGKPGGGGMDAVETAKQENATRLYCEKYVGSKKFPSAAELAAVYEGADDEWIHTFERQAKAIKGFLTGTNYTWSRDDGIMPYLEGIAKTKCGVRTKDSWNPADIYCVRTSAMRSVMKKIKEIGDMAIEPRARLDLLNDYMRTAFHKQDLVGISLKKLGKGSVQLEPTNVEKKPPLDDISIIANSVLIDLDLNSKGEFNTGELSFKLNIQGAIVNVQIRAFSGGVRESTQMDMTGSGAAAKLGKVSSREAIDPYLTPLGLKRRMGAALPAVGAWTAADIKTYVDEQRQLQSLTIGGSGIYWGRSKWNKTLPLAIEAEKNNNRTASQLSAKLQCFQWIKIMNDIEKKGKLKEFLTVLYYGAKKQYDSAGPFLKVS